MQDTFTWVDGFKANGFNINWESGEQNQGQGNCVIIAHSTFTWNVVSCDDEHVGLCEKMFT